MYNELVKHFEKCGFTEEQAKKELETIIKYHTTGLDRVSREYAIEMIYEDMIEE